MVSVAVPARNSEVDMETTTPCVYPEGGPGRHLKARLGAGEVLVGGILSEYARASLVKIYREAGFDFIYVETEHSLFDPVLFSEAVQVARDNRLPVIAKVGGLDRAATTHLLDSGVVGIQLPRTETRAQVEQLHDYLKLPPAGTRSFAPGYGSSDYRRELDPVDWIEDQNAETTLVVHIETRKGYENAEDIVTFPGVDLVYVGPGDFSVEFGHPGDPDHRDVAGPAEEILELCKAHDVPFGTTASGSESAMRWIAKGALFFQAHDELEFVYAGASALVREYRRFVRDR